jgi:hypothetical protein
MINMTTPQTQSAEVLVLIKDFTMISTESKLIAALIAERAQRILDYDEAYPDVGMGMSWQAARYQAITALKNEGLLPSTYKE